MPPARAVTVTPGDYHRWTTRSVTMHGQSFPVATKPGLIGHGNPDPAASLLANLAVVPSGGTVVQMQCGAGLCGLSAAISGRASAVYFTDRSAVAVEAVRRSVEANAVTNATVLLGHGSAPLGAEVRADLVAIRIPTEKVALLQLLADAFAVLRIGGQCCIAGATNEGIKSAATLLKSLFGNASVLGTDSGHRAVMAIKRAPTPHDTAALAHAYVQHDAFYPLDVTLRGVSLQLFSRPGVFSWEHLDDATSILTDTMEISAGDSILDLGCGSGAIGLLAARMASDTQVTLVDVDSEAIRCVQRAVALPGATNCEVLSSDVASAVLDRRFDQVLTNPPFHVGKATALDVPQQFIADAWTVLKPGGRLSLVANRTLPYERVIKERFGNLTTLYNGSRFKVLSARRQ